MEPIRAPHLRYIAAMFIWGFNGWIVSHITSLSSVEIVFMRTFLGAFSLLIVVLIRRSFDWSQFRKEGLLLLGCGACLGLHWVALFSAFRYAGVGLSTLIDYCGPMLVVVLSPLLFREKLLWNKVVGAVSASLGLICVTGSITLGGDVGRGVFFALGSALSYALLIVLNKFLHQMRGLEAAMTELMMAFGVLFLYLIFTTGLPNFNVGSEIVYILLLGVINTGLAFYLYFSPMRAMSAQSVALLSYIEPVSALFISAALLGELLLPLQILGAILIIGGAMLGEVALKRKRKLD